MGPLVADAAIPPPAVKERLLDAPVMPTLHPAFLLRQPAAKKKAWQDLLTLTERLDRQGRPA